MNDRKIIFFDGECVMCNSWYKQIAKRDKTQKFFYSTLQSSTAQSILISLEKNTHALDTVIYVRGEKIYVQSTAVIFICKDLGRFYKLFITALLIPRFIRDALYQFVAKRRYKWFGQQVCMIPSKEMQKRFLD